MCMAVKNMRRSLNYFAHVSDWIGKEKKFKFLLMVKESWKFKQIWLYSNVWSNAAKYDLLTSLPKFWFLCFAERKRSGFLWHRFIKNIVLTARIRLPCIFLLLVIKHPVGNIWDHKKWLAQMFCPVHRPCGSSDSSPGLNSPVCQLGKAIPPGHAANP